MPKCILLLEDGSVFEGKSFGKIGTTLGEICFNTGMTGYQEIFSDPSYFGQIVILTNSHLGNYGSNSEDVESGDIQVSGVICRNFSKNYSRHNATSLQNYLDNTVGIQDIDTRALVNHIRDFGVQNCIISSEIFEISELKKRLMAHPKMTGQSLHQQVTCSRIRKYGTGKHKIGILDLGIKDSIIKNLLKFDTNLVVFPSTTDLETIKSFEVDGFFISNGPGDPQAMPEMVELVKQIINLKKPVFGICMGHQLIGLANNISAYKMFYGHRGCNHPVKNLETGKCEITSQNHGFCLVREQILNNPDLEITHEHLNDQTVMGIKMKNLPVFSVQYHPEAGPGPNDSKYLFEKFIEEIKLCQETTLLAQY
jgi:carbamoyl-phosphate synthase small subunit